MLGTPLTGPLTQSLSVATNMSTSVLPGNRPPAGFTFIRTVFDTKMRDQAGVAVIAPEVST